jgi:glutamate dehydrogenase
MFYRPDGAAPNRINLKLYQGGEPKAISDVLPTLENLGLRLISERPYEVSSQDQAPRWIQDFELELAAGTSLDLAVDGGRLTAAVTALWQGRAENDGFNRLVLGARLSWRETVVLRAYCRWLLQTGISFSQPYMESVLAANAGTAERLARLFVIQFDPALSARQRESHAARLRRELDSDLAAVERLDEDRILRAFRAAIDATLRTNYFQVRAGSTEPKSYLSVKIDPSRVPGLPEPRPMFEIWVYAPRVEGVHLRKGRVARGGLRWSDRYEDFRTEVLGLMKAQNVKNTVIVPVGAKGGFVCRRLPIGRDAAQQELVSCYQDFVRGLLDLTDNIVDGAIVPPAATLRRDKDDPYLVVAADKSRPTKARRPSPTSPTQSRPTTGSGSETRSPPAARPATTTRRSRSPRAAHGNASSATSASWASTRRPGISPSSASVTCPATCSATACCARDMRASWRRSITSTSS